MTTPARILTVCTGNVCRSPYLERALQTELDRSWGPGEVEVSHDGRPFLEWHSRTWLLDEAGQKVRPLATELGFWRPVEGGEVELLLTHPTGIVEMYYGKAEPAKVELRTDGVLRSPHAKEYNAASRLYGLVNSNLLWAMDMAAVGQSLQSHVSAELKRVG